MCFVMHVYLCSWVFMGVCACVRETTSSKARGRESETERERDIVRDTGTERASIKVERI